MSKLATLGLAAALVPGCVAAHDEPAGNFGFVQVVWDNAAPTVYARACLDAELLVFCKGKDIALSVVHDGVTTDMPYWGLFNPDHSAFAPLGNATTAFDVTDGTDHAIVVLPPAFDLAVSSTPTHVRGDVLHATWTASTEHLDWHAAYTCEQTNGATIVGEGWIADLVDPDGAADLAIEPIAKLIDDATVDNPTTSRPCDVTIRVERTLAGSLTPDFHAGSATAYVRREIDFQLAR